MTAIVKRLRPDQWAWVHAKLALVVWAVLFFCFTPIQVADTLDITLAVLLSVVIVVGVPMSIVGLFLSVSKSIKRIRLGFNLELSGLWIAISGPIAYFLTRFYLIFTPGGEQGIALAALSYFVFAATLTRIAQVYVSRKRVLL